MFGEKNGEVQRMVWAHAFAQAFLAAEGKVGGDEEKAFQAARIADRAADASLLELLIRERDKAQRIVNFTVGMGADHEKAARERLQDGESAVKATRLEFRRRHGEELYHWRDWYDATELECDPHELYCDKPAPQVCAFMREVMPELCKLLRAELAAEKATAAA